MSFQIKQPAPDQLRVELFGHFDGKDAKALEAELAKTTGALPPKTFNVVFSMVGLTECAMDGREVLVRIQTALAKVARRTAYVDDRAKFRGMALWVMHLAQDGDAKAVVNMEQARAWFASSVDRVVAAERRTLGVA